MSDKDKNNSRDDSTFLTTIEIYYPILLIGILVFEYLRVKWQTAYLHPLRIKKLFLSATKVLKEEMGYPPSIQATQDDISELHDTSISNTNLETEATYHRLSPIPVLTTTHPTTSTSMDYTQRLNEEFFYLKQSYGFLGWIFPFLSVSDDHIYLFYGMESLFFLRIQRLGMKLALCCMFCSIILFPLYATSKSQRNADGHKIVSQILQYISLANVPPNSIRLLGSILCLYLITAYCLYLLYHEHLAYVKYRHRYMKQYRVEHYSIIVSDIRYNLRSTDKLYEYMDYLFPNQVYQVSFILDCFNLTKLIGERDKARDRLEEAIFSAHPNAGDTESQSLCWKSKQPKSDDEVRDEEKSLRDPQEARAGKMINKIEECEQTLSTMNEKLKDAIDVVRKKAEKEEKQVTEDSPDTPNSLLYKNIKSVSEVLKNDKTISNVAFVLFTTVRAKQILTQVLQDENPQKMCIEGAPHPKDAKWENMVNTTYKLRSAAQLISTVVTVWIVFFWTVPTAFVSSLANVSNLRQSVKFIDTLLKKYPSLSGFFEQLAPLSIVVMGILVKIIFDQLSQKEKHFSHWATRTALFLKLTSYNLVQSFFIFAISGSIWSQISKILNGPKELLNFLGTALPGQAVFFITVIVVQTNLGLTLEMLRVVSIAKHLLFLRFAPQKTPRQRYSSWLFGLQSLDLHEDFDPTANYADNVFVFVLLMTYCVISPLLSYFVFLYFLFSNIVFRRQIFTVYKISHDSFGSYWPKLYGFLLGSIILSQLTLLGYFGLKKSGGAVAATFVLLILTLIYHKHINRRFKLASLYMPINQCIQIDSERKARAAVINDVLENQYVQPILKTECDIGPELSEEKLAFEADED